MDKLIFPAFLVCAGLAVFGNLITQHNEAQLAAQSPIVEQPLEETVAQRSELEELLGLDAGTQRPVIALIAPGAEHGPAIEANAE